MNRISAGDYVARLRYPGRLIIVGRDETARFAVIAYAIMGRSVNSRNRIFVPDGAGIRTQAFDPSKMEDPSLIIYRPVAVHGDYTIVTNGDQTDTIDAYLEKGKGFEEALRTRCFEPDAPNYTPRISALVSHLQAGVQARFSILKADDQSGEGCLRCFYEYERIASGRGYAIHTYEDDGNPLPSYRGEPQTVAIAGDIDEFTDALWNGLNKENRVSLFVRFVGIENGSSQDRIVNRYPENK